MSGMHGKVGVKPLVARACIKCLYLRNFFYLLLRGKGHGFTNNLKIVFYRYLKFSELKQYSHCRNI